MYSLHFNPSQVNTHPEQWAAMLQRPGSSWGFGALLKDTSVVVLKEDTPPPTIPAGPEIRTHNLPLTSPTRYPLGPRHASLRHHATQSDVPSRIARINIVCLHYDAIYSFGCFIFTFMKPSSAVNYLYVHTDDGGVEALLFAVKRLINAVSESCRKMRRKVLHDSNSVIKVFTCLYCTSIMRLK